MGFIVDGYAPRFRLNDPQDRSMAQWSFIIELDFTDAVRFYAKSLPTDALKHLNEYAIIQHENIFKDWEPERSLFPRRRVFGFWDERCLLTNVTVEPGNACGLDMDHNDFESVKRGHGTHRQKVRYLPHNVDSHRQASALLASWLFWYSHTEALLGAE